MSQLLLLGFYSMFAVFGTMKAANLESSLCCNIIMQQGICPHIPMPCRAIWDLSIIWRSKANSPHPSIISWDVLLWSSLLSLHRARAFWLVVVNTCNSHYLQLSFIRVASCCYINNKLKSCIEFFRIWLSIFNTTKIKLHRDLMLLCFYMNFVWEGNFGS